MFRNVLLAAMLALSGTNAVASDLNRGVASERGAFIKPAALRVVVPALQDPADARLVTIYNDLSRYSKSPYWAWTQASVNGSSGGQPEIWTATPFTPSANHSATKIEVAAIWSSGANGLVLSLNSDANGVPGSALKTWQLTNLPSSLCCTIEAAIARKGIALSAATQYWIVLSTNASEAGTSAGWALSEVDQADGATLAQYCSDDKGGSCAQYGLGNDVWTTFPSLYGVAFAVLGSS